MKKVRAFAVLLCAVLLITNIPLQVKAFERKDHDKYMSEVLFKNFKVIENDFTVQDEIEALESACYLAIDQFNGSGQKDLDVLINYGVKDIPKTVNEINYQEFGDKHRSYTHNGWDYIYNEKMKQLWPKRQAIMLNTADRVFDFKGNIKKQESFCKLLYYIHILGDHKADTSWEIENGLKMGVGGRNDDYDIIHELLNSIEVLFADQKHTHKYRSLTNNLQRIDSKFGKIVNSDGGVNSDEKFKLYQEYTDDTMKILTLYLPEMLKEEMFFHKVFY